ncbi:hypothetical protein FRC12_015145 [Ceratobasidium sp. 428]|nr:hypothetical protein FRC12_015145 [Ceratobasidium sp. 428]
MNIPGKFATGLNQPTAKPDLTPEIAFNYSESTAMRYNGDVRDIEGPITEPEPNPNALEARHSFNKLV